MSITSRTPGGPAASFRHRRSPGLLSRIMVPAAILAVGYVAVILVSDILTPLPVTSRAPMPATTAVVVAKAAPYTALLDPGLSLGAPPQLLAQAPPLDADFRPAAVAPEALAPSLVELEPEPPQVEPPVQLPLPPLPLDRPLLVEDAPRPVPRPSDLIAPAAPERPRIAERQSPRRSRTAAAVAAAPDDNRSFFQKLFGVQRSSGTALAYAAPQDDVIDAGRGRRLSPLTTPAPASAQATAVYDISARVVYMPNGERLEAHSGLGEYLDDARNVHLRMRGATPPHTYTLTERESLFHGVRAIRLNPVGGSGAIHGRAGLLAHTYMLGPNGDSNGCISFKDYERFLQAYLRGEVKRLVVVAGRG